MLQPSQRRLRMYTYLAGFFLAGSGAIAAYVNSSFLGQFVREQDVGMVYALAAGAALLLSFGTSTLIKRFGNRQMIMGLGTINVLTLAGIIYSNSQLAILYVGVYLTINILLAIHLDLCLESLSNNHHAGQIRGLFLTITNLAWLLSPFIAGQLAELFDYYAIYIIAASSLLTFLYIVRRWLPEHEVSTQAHLNIWQAWQHLQHATTSHSQQLKKIIKLDFLLNIFYAIMVVYMPIYLLNYAHFSWSQVGLIFTIMLLPFVLLDFALGSIADKLWGEKEMMIVGLSIMSLATLAVGLSGELSLGLWALLLFATRVGAACVEMMKEAYLFKKIDHRDVNMIFLSRDTYPIAYIVSTLAASWWLAVFPLQSLFIALSLLLLLGFRPALTLRDTK